MTDRLLTVIVVLCLPFATFAEGPAQDYCESALSGRIEAALQKTFLVDHMGTTEELRRIDKHLVSEILSLLPKLSPLRREAFLKVLENSSIGYFFDGYSKEYDRNLMGVSGFGQVAVNEKGLTLAIFVLAATNPLSRITLVHELSHLVSLIPEGPASDAEARMKSIINRRFGLYREELNAFKQQYRFIRKYFSRADVERWKNDNVAPSPRQLAIIKEGNFFDKNGSLIGEKFIRCNPEQLEAIVASYIYEMNKINIEYAEDALTMNESDAVKKWVRRGNYKTKQLALILQPYFAQLEIWKPRLAATVTALVSYLLFY